jgi:hypothetical protein
VWALGSKVGLTSGPAGPGPRTHVYTNYLYAWLLSEQAKNPFWLVKGRFSIEANNTIIFPEQYDTLISLQGFFFFHLYVHLIIQRNLKMIT